MKIQNEMTHLIERNVMSENNVMTSLSTKIQFLIFLRIQKELSEIASLNQKSTLSRSVGNSTCSS